MAPVPKLCGEHRTYFGFAQPFAVHSHNHYVIGRVTKGERILQLNGNSMRIAPGDIMVFNPGDVHSCRHASADPFAYDSVTVASHVFEGATLRFPSRNDAESSSVCSRLMNALKTGNGEQAADSALVLASLLEVEGNAKGAACAHDESALRVYAHLCGHIAEPSRIAYLAAAEGLSEYALIRAYRKRFAITPLQHLMSLRVECARELLLEGAAPADVAAEVGFSDQAHFTRVFKQRMGITPAAYRKMARGEGAAE